jgi:hypothetical protein
LSRCFYRRKGCSACVATEWNRVDLLEIPNRHDKKL